MLQWFVPTFPVALVWVYVAGACGMASLIGILAGLTPALKAAKMNPVDALRAN
jgi:putative ABC transport system permease protein